MDPVAILRHYIGYHETGDNVNLFSADLGHPPEAWCGDAVSDSYRLAGHPLPSMQPGCKTGFAAVWYGYTWALKNGLAVPSWEAQRNDLVCFGWQGLGIRGDWNQMHVALVESSGPQGALLRYVGGNQQNAVGEETITVGSDLIIGCIQASKFLQTPVPTHTPAPAPVPPQVTHGGGKSAPVPVQPTPAQPPHLAIGMWHPTWPIFMVKTPLMRQHPAVREYQQRMVDRGWKRVPQNTPYSHHPGNQITADGIFGPDTAAITWAFQEEKGLTHDGQLGPVTWLQASRTDNVTR